MFTDLVDSSSRWERAPAEMEAALSRHDEMFENLITAHRGHVVKKMGDGFMAVFHDPAQAVAAAVQAQQTLADAPSSEVVGPLETRIGIHTGPATLESDDYHGPTVNRAARLEAAGHGGQILVSAATHDLMVDRLDVSFRDLGEHQLRGITRPERVFQVEADALTRAFPPLRTESTPSNLPAAIRSVVGRRQELETLLATLADHRLLTITGAGGAGKTTLALEAARQSTADHPAGVWLVELAGLTDGRRIPTEILGAIRRPAPADRDQLDALVDAVRGQRLLLVLDNCEHLRQDVARMVTRLLREVADLKILATSREPLAVSGEQAWRIPTMSLPESATAAAVLASDAGAWFEACARAADPAFAVTADNAAVVSEVCTKLDALPLAIELACARLRSMSLTDLNSRLDDRLSLLRGGADDGVAHHRTMRDTVAWSYDLLSPTEQALFRRLSVFAGGFDLAAAEELGATVAEADQVVDLLDQLVAQSLIQHGDGRYRMLETIRQFAGELLDALNETDAASSAHLAWMLELARTGGRELEGRDQIKWLHRFQTEMDNVRAALAWALEHDPVTGATAMTALTRFFWMNAMEADAHTTDARTFLAEGYDWASALMDAAGERLPGKTRARLQSGVGGMLCVRAGRYQEAIDRLAESQAIFQELGDPRGLGWSLFYDGVAGWGARSPSETIEIFRRALQSHTEAADKAGQLFSTLLLGWALGFAGEYTEGRVHIDRFAEAASAIKVPNIAAHAGEAVAMFDCWQDRVDDNSIRHTIESLESFRQINNYACLTHALGSAALVLVQLGDLESPGIVIGISQAIRQRLNMVLAPYEDRTEIAVNAYSTAAALDRLRHAEGAPRWDAAVAKGRTMEPDEGIDWTIRQLGRDFTGDL